MTQPIHPIQAMADGMSKAWQAERSKTQLTLGELIEVLSQLASDRMVVGLGEPISYRGYYSDLAFEPDATPRPVADVLAMARGCMGKTFEGYKGGDFDMGARTPLWSAHYGESSGDRIMGLQTDRDPITLILSPEPNDV